jgi:hypothetical protein
LSVRELEPECQRRISLIIGDLILTNRFFIGKIIGAMELFDL